MTPEQRAKFEEYAESEGLELTRDGDGDYDSNETNDVCRGWQAALASDTRRPVVDVEDAIAGFNAKSQYQAHQNILRWIIGKDEKPCRATSGYQRACDTALKLGRELRANTASE